MDPSPTVGKGFGQNATATADIEHGFAGDVQVFVDVAGTDRVHGVQWFEL